MGLFYNHPIIVPSLHELMDVMNIWASQIIITLGYPGLGLVMFLENIFPPLPSEIVLPLAGSLTLKGEFSLAGIALVGMAGSVAGAWVFYGIGYWIDEKRVRFFIRKFGKWFMLSENDLNRALAWFQRYGDWVIFFGRMVPMVRSLISIPAGLSRMNIIRFTLFTALGTASWSFILAFAGRQLGQNWHMVDQFLSQYETLILALIGFGLLVFILTKMKNRQFFGIKSNP